MTPQTLKLEAEISVQNTMSSSEIFSIVQQISTQINESRMQRVVEAVKSLTTDENQLIVDLLAIALEKHHHILMNPDRVMNLLTQIALSANVMARNRTLTSEYHTSSIESSPEMYIVHSEPPSRVRVIKKGILGTFSKSLLSWAHLSHPNILPVYVGAFLNDNNGHISLVSPLLDRRIIVDHAKTLPQIERMPLLSDIIDGLCYLHQLDIVHGALNVQCVFVSDNGQALITDLDVSTQTLSARFSAPEVLENEDTSPARAADVWAFGCLCYEVLSGNVPFCQYLQEAKVPLAVFKGKRPTRPGQEGVMGEKIDDVMWRPVSACWEFEPEDRPTCSKLRDALASMNIQDNRPIPAPSPALGNVEAPAIDLESARSLLNRVLGSNESLPPPSQIPEHLREPLSGLADGLSKADAVAVAVKKFNPDDTQTLVDILDLLFEEDPSLIRTFNPTRKLMRMVMEATHVYPQRYKLRRIRYGPSPIAEDSFVKVYKGSDLDVCVSLVTDSRYNLFEYLAVWAHSSHPNVLPFNGMFNEAVNGISRFCIVSPYMKNGTLYEYAPRIPQSSRFSLISDIIDGLEYFHSLDFIIGLRPDIVLISDEGRALITDDTIAPILTCTAAAKAIRSSATRAVRFEAPELVKWQQHTRETDIWSFGCLSYEVLSGKPPYHQYTEKSEIENALAWGSGLSRPSATENDAETIEDQPWEMIMGCCRTSPADRLTVRDIQQLLPNLSTSEDRPDPRQLPGAAIMNLRKRPDIEWNRVKHLLDQIQVELLRNPLSKLVQNHIKDVAAEAVRLDHDDVQTLVNFLDVTLKDHLTISDERNRVLALLSRITTSSQVFPQRHEMKGIKYDPKPIAEGGFGKVHRGSSDPTLCVKVTTRVNDPRALAAYIKELILWVHSSHPNVLPFYGVFIDDSQQICLVSPYMEKGNLSGYACQLPQKFRVPLLLDTVKGLDYLHGLGIVHTDLKGENVLISDEGRGLLTDFGASHVVTATAKGAHTGAAVTSTLRFTAPEIIRDETQRVKPTKECDIWSFGCLCYQILSRKLPYYEYQLDTQVTGALYRGQLPKRPGLTSNDTDDDSDEDWDDVDEKDWDDLDDTTWGLIMKCLVPKPEERPSASRIQELIVDMKAWDSRPPAKSVPGAEILKQKVTVEVNLNRIGALLVHLQILFLARSIYGYSDQEVVAAVLRLEQHDADTLSHLWSSALNNHLSLPGDRSRLIAIISALSLSRQRIQASYMLRTQPKFYPKVIGEGSFGKVYRGSDLNICVKVMPFHTYDGLWAQWHLALAPWAYSSHINILPFYGVFFSDASYLVSPFIENGSLHSFSPRLSQESRMLLILDVIEGLVYLHKLGIIHGNLKTQNVLISDEGRGLITDFRPYYPSVAAAVGRPTGSFITSTLRFTAPELVRDNQMLPTTASDVWSVGCLIYEVLLQKVPYYKYTEYHEIRSALSRNELPIRPASPDGDTDGMDDESWSLIVQCCSLEPGSRLMLPSIQDWLGKMDLEDKRPITKAFPGAEILKERFQHRDMDVTRMGEMLDKLKLTPEREKGDEDRN